VPNKIRAAILRNIGKDLSVEDVDFAPLAYGQVLVKMHYSGICRSQLMEQKGLRGVDKWIPHLLGHEGFGVVEEIGDGVTKCLPGDQVVLSWVAGIGINAENAVYRDADQNVVNSGKITTFSNFSVVSENRLFLAPKGFSEKLLALFGCALLTGGGMALKYGQSETVKKVCVVGFGGIGSAAALVLKGMGKPHIDIVESSSEKRAQALQLGFINVYPQIAEGSHDYDLVIEASGTVEAIEKGFAKLSNSGTLVFASHPEAGSKISLDPHDLIKGKRIFGTWGGDINPDSEMAIIGQYIANSASNLELLLGDTFTIDEVNIGLAYLDSGKPGRPLLKLDED
jgi:S-(hydroxymethyl)glutathione dehydrogenase/alcohol dehydrogenase